MQKKSNFVRDHAPGQGPMCSPKAAVADESMAKAKKKIDELVKKNKVVLFMKGTKDQPMCGFSAQVTDVLHDLEVDFKDVNVLDDENIRAAVKEYSDWPTLPQLYIDGKFVGGCDITLELYQSGELQKLLAD